VASQGAEPDGVYIATKGDVELAALGRRLLAPLLFLLLL
jgi:hypothetical protein